MNRCTNKCKMWRHAACRNKDFGGLCKLPNEQYLKLTGGTTAPEPNSSEDAARDYEREVIARETAARNEKNSAETPNATENAVENASTDEKSEKKGLFGWGKKK